MYIKFFITKTLSYKYSAKMSKFVGKLHIQNKKGNVWEVSTIYNAGCYRFPVAGNKGQEICNWYYRYRGKSLQEGSVACKIRKCGESSSGRYFWILITILLYLRWFKHN